MRSRRKANIFLFILFCRGVRLLCLFVLFCRGVRLQRLRLPLNTFWVLHSLPILPGVNLSTYYYPQTPLKSRHFNIRWLNLQGVQRRREPWQLRVWQWNFPHGRTNALYRKVSSIFFSEESKILLLFFVKTCENPISAARQAVTTRTQRCTGTAGNNAPLSFFFWYLHQTTMYFGPTIS